jgi:transposase InsO family protein
LKALRSQNESMNAIISNDWTRITHEKYLTIENNLKSWKKYEWCSLFKHMIVYLRHELNEISVLSRQKRKVIINQSRKYSLVSRKSLLMYHEKDDRRFSCLVKNQIESILKHLHDDHEHYSHAIILDRMKEETYWSTRIQNVIVWCKSCSVCQLNAKKHFTTAIRHILTFEFMSMIELDFLSFIKLACAMIKCRYILIEVNYFSRFVWARSYVHCTMTKSIDLMNNLIASIFEWSRTLYSNNEKHFTRYDFEKLLKAKRVIHFIASITHSSSMRLIERMI